MGVEENINDRKAAQELHRVVGELLASEVGNLPSDQSRLIFFGMLLESAKKNLGRPENQKASDDKRKPRKPAVQDDANSDDVQEAMEINDEIQSLAYEVAWPDAPDVADKAADIIEVVESRNYASPGQLEALRNMLNGMRAWCRDWD